MKKKFAIFDMDGTLADSVVFWKNVGREYLILQKITENVEEVVKRTKRLSMSECATALIQEFALEETQESVEAAMNAIMEEHYRKDIVLKPGVKEYLEKLAKAGVRMCVASASEEFLMEACLSRLGVAQYFEFILSCETVGAGKKQPDIFLEAARRFHALPGEIAVYEDMRYAAETAAKAGFYTVYVYDETSKHDWEKRTEVAKEWIKDWSEAAKNL